jgi:hypothetical protein
VYPRKKDHPRNFFNAIVGDAKRQVENKRVADVVSAGSIEHDLRMALQVIFYTIYRSVYLPKPSYRNEKIQMWLSTCPYTIGRLTLYCCPTGRSKSSMNPTASLLRPLPVSQI